MRRIPFWRLYARIQLYPMIGWTGAVVLGTACGFFFGHPLLYSGVILLTLLAFWSWRHPTALHPTCMILFALAGFHGAIAHNQYTLALDRFIAAKGQALDLTVLVGNDRQIIQRKRGGPYCRFLVERATFDDGRPVRNVHLKVSYYGNMANAPNMGETWRIRARVGFNSFHNRMQLSVREPQAQRLATVNYFDPRFTACRLRERLAKHLAVGIPADIANLLQKLSLGTSRKLPAAYQRLFADCGVIHIFSVSGLHVSIIVGILYFFWKCTGIGFRWRGVLCLPFLLVYLLITGFTPSAVRAALMGSLYLLAPLFLRKSNALHALGLTTIVVLLLKPEWLTQAGAILSFSVMGGLLLYVPPLVYFLSRAFRALHYENTREHRGTLPLSLSLRRTVAGTLSVMVAAWLGSLPWCLYYFGQCSVSGIFLNLFIPFLATFILWGAVLSALLGFVCLPLSWLLNIINAQLITIIVLVCRMAHDTPWCVFQLGHNLSIGATLILQLLIIRLGIYLRDLETAARENDPDDPITFRFLPT